VIYGRSDATINRHGIRMGTAELYRAVEAQPEVLDSLVVDLEYLGRESWMPLFVVLREGARARRGAGTAPEARRSVQRAVGAPRAQRDLPGAAIPRTLSGKKMELPVKKLLMGADPTSPTVSAVLQPRRHGQCRPAASDWFVFTSTTSAFGEALACSASSASMRAGSSSSSRCSL
jgi:acetoacetyl-CoA synthetase